MGLIYFLSSIVLIQIVVVIYCSFYLSKTYKRFYLTGGWYVILSVGFVVGVHLGIAKEAEMRVAEIMDTYQMACIKVEVCVRSGVDPLSQLDVLQSGHLLQKKIDAFNDRAESKWTSYYYRPYMKVINRINVDKLISKKPLPRNIIL